MLFVVLRNDQSLDLVFPCRPSLRKLNTEGADEVVLTTVFIHDCYRQIILVDYAELESLVLSWAGSTSIMSLTFI
jgi:hypothetical protein